jgi:hypothetical protein
MQTSGVPEDEGRANEPPIGALSEVDRKQLIKELRSLRRGEAVTQDRMRQCPTFMRIVGVDRHDDAFSVLVRVVRALSRTQHGQALANAYGWGGVSHARIEKRRELFGESLDPPKSPDTIKRWENAAIERLVGLTQDFTHEALVQPELQIAQLVGFVDGARMVGCVLTRTGIEGAFWIPNPNATRSVPTLLFEPPREAGNLDQLVLMINWLNETRPSEVWASYGPTIFEALTGSSRVDLETAVVDDEVVTVATVVQPRSDWWHAISWHL